MFPIPNEVGRRIEVSMIGKNQLTIPIAQNLTSQLYDISLYYRKDLSDSRKLSDDITMIEIADYEEDLLERLGLFERDIVVCSTNDDHINKSVALMAKNMVLNVLYMSTRKHKRRSDIETSRYRGV